MSAREVELVLAGHPAVKAVAVVVPRSGRQPDLETLQAHARASLAGFKVPKRVEVVAALPQNPNGKVDKVALRAQIRSHLHSSPKWGSKPGP